MIEVTIREQMTTAMKAKDKDRLKVLRSLKAAIQTEAVSEKTARELTDDEVIKVLMTEAKKRSESIEAFEQAGRTEMASAERAELTIISEFLPEPLSDEELNSIIETVIADNGFTSPADMGQAMKLISAQTQGRADGKTVAGLVKEKLS